jgi:IS1 family transposase
MQKMARRKKKIQRKTAQSHLIGASGRSNAEVVKDRLKKVAELFVNGEDVETLVVAPTQHPTTTKSIPKPTVQIPSIIRQESEDEAKRQVAAEAEANRAHYVEHRKKDGAKNPWHHYVKTATQYSEHIFVTPDEAEQCLLHNEGNRDLKSPTVEAYARDMLSGSWMQTGESIDIDTQSALQNGQHRLSAIVRANKLNADFEGQIFYFTFNVPCDSRWAIDSGAKRNVNDKLKLVLDVHMGNSTAAVCRAMMRGSNGSNIKYSESEIAAFALKHQDTLVWLHSNIGKIRADVMAAIGKCVLWYGAEKISDFADRFRTMVFNDQNDPAKLLMIWLQKTKTSKAYTSPVDVYQKSLSCTIAAAEGRTIAKVRSRQDDIFEWEDGWVVPTK